jgi:hypothetical protein
MIIEPGKEPRDTLHGLAINRDHDVTGDHAPIASQTNAAETHHIGG